MSVEQIDLNASFAHIPDDGTCEVTFTLVQAALDENKATSEFKFTASEMEFDPEQKTARAIVLRDTARIETEILLYDAVLSENQERCAGRISSKSFMFRRLADTWAILTCETSQDPDQ